MRPPILLLLLAGAGAIPASSALVDPHRTDTNHSTVGFSVPILGGLSRVTGKFSRFELELQYDAEQPEASRVLARIDAASIDTGIDERDAHLRTEDFLHVEEFPEIVYESFEVIPKEDHLEVLGVLTLRGESRDVNLTVKVLDESGGGDSVGFHATATFDRQDFGVRYKHRDVPDFVGDEMTVTLHLLTHSAR